MTIENGNRKEAQLQVKHYAEIIKKATTATDILTGQKVDLTKNITLPQRGVMVLAF